MASRQPPDYTVSHSSEKLKPLEAWKGPSQYRIFRFPEFLDNWHVKVVVLSALLGQDYYHGCKKSRGVKPTTQLYLKDKEITWRHTVTAQTFERGLSANNLPTGFMPPTKVKGYEVGSSLGSLVLQGSKAVQWTEVPVLHLQTFIQLFFEFSVN